MIDASTAESPPPGANVSRASAPLASLESSPRFLPALAILFVGSGCAALIYEIVWLQLLQLVIGASAISLGVLLGTFMGGMCLGSLLLPRLISSRRHPLAVYASLELAIGAIGLLELALVPWVSDLYTHLATSGSASIVLRALLAGICLLPPTMLMGATLPAIARWVEATPRGVSWLGFFYGGNIVGAVFGCLLAGFYLLRVYDMRTATLVAAAINGGVALLGYSLSLATHRSAAMRSEMAAAKPTLPASGAWSVYVAIALSGLTALGAEVIWTRLLSLMLGATVYTFSNILAVFLLGLGIGSSVGSFVARSAPRPRLALAWCQFLLALAIAWAAYGISFSLPFWPIYPGMGSMGSMPMGPWYTFQVDLARCCWVILPAALLWGASFPLALASIAARGQDAGRLVGGVYAANTVGAIIGSLAFSMFLVPILGTSGSERLLIVLCVVSAIVAVLPLFSANRDETESAAASPVPLATAILAMIAAGFWLALSVGPPNWASVAWGRNSAYEIAGGEARSDARGDYPIFPAMLTVDEIDLVKEAKNKGLGGLRLDAGNLTYDPLSLIEENRADAASWVGAHRDKLLSALHKREALTGQGNLLSYDDKRLPNRYCAYIGEGMNVSVAVTYDDWGYRYFHGAGKVQASSNPLDMRLQRTLGHITALTTLGMKDPKDVLVVACGAGVTAGSFVPYGSNITIVDIEAMVPRYVTPQFAKENYSVIPNSVARLSDAEMKNYHGYEHTEVIIDDGRHFIRTTPRKFDIITSDPIDPWVKGCAALNTVEYYQMCKDHLKPGGVVALWIPLYESSEDTAKSVICTFFKVFPNGILWSNDDNGSGYDAVLFAKIGDDGSVDKPTKINIDDIQDYLDAHPKVKQSLQDVGFKPQADVEGQPASGQCEAVELLATYAGTAPRMQAWIEGTEDLINYDRNLRLQYVAGLHVNENIAPQIFNGILKNYQFPDEIFTGAPERIAALKQLLAKTGRVEHR